MLPVQLQTLPLQVTGDLGHDSPVNVVVAAPVEKIHIALSNFCYVETGDQKSLHLAGFANKSGQQIYLVACKDGV